MSVTRLKRKNRKDKAKSARRRLDLKIQNFQPVMKSVDVEKIKEEFKTKKAAKKAWYTPWISQEATLRSIVAF